MTNETTASQPNSIGDDARNEIRTAVWEGLKGLYYCGRVWCAWQVGTMGQDDFTPAEDMDEVIDPIVDGVVAALEKSRAPAAQAFATIQAAPDMSKLDRYEEYGNESGGGLQEAPDGDFVRLSDVEALIAATIQEPVMVAEPVENSWRKLAMQFDGQRMAALAHLRAMLSDSAKHAAIATEFLSAAPMVADPAGVATVYEWRHRHAEHMPWGEWKLCDKDQYDLVVERTRQNLSLQSSIKLDEVRATLAATVKAVPSEALEVVGQQCGFPETSWGRLCDPEEIEPMKARGYYFRTVFAAPLADKTGGT